MLLIKSFQGVVSFCQLSVCPVHHHIGSTTLVLMLADTVIDLWLMLAFHAGQSLPSKVAVRMYTELGLMYREDRRVVHTFIVQQNKS